MLLRQHLVHLSSIEEDQTKHFYHKEAAKTQPLICGAALLFVPVIHGLLMLSVTFL